MNAANVFTAVFIGLFVGHQLGDYLLQTSWQVEHKGDRGGLGWLAAAGHVASYTAATVITAGVTLLVLGLHVTAHAFILSQLFSAVTHLVIDRRFTLRWLMVQVDRVIPGKLDYYDNGGAPFLDQMAHIVCLLGSALIMAAGVAA